MADDKAKKDDKATKNTNDDAKKTDRVSEKPITDEDARTISGGIGSVKWKDS